MADRLAERERLARDLHDTLLQGFQGLMLHFQAVLKQIPEHLPANEAMKKTLNQADHVLIEGRNRVRGLRAEGPERLELSKTLAAYGENLAKDDSIEFKMMVVGSPRWLHPVVADEVLSIAREALANAFRHSAASKIELDITYATKNFSLRVRDNGSGMDEEMLRHGRRGHWGLSGMRERAQNIRALLSFGSRPGAGTEIDLTLPAELAYARHERTRRWQWINFGVNGRG